MTLRARPDGRAGLYVHIPFCDTICPYCDFAVTRQRIDHERYVDAVLQELEHFAPRALDGRCVQTIYLGGGTPSALELRALQRLLGELRRAAGDEVREITLEANPLDVSEQAVSAWRDAGVNRVSLGVQSFQDHTLRALGRNHDAGAALRAANLLARVEGLRVSLDLIYASPGQDAASWADELRLLRDEVAHEGISHLSLYQLTVEPRTPFAVRRARGELVLPDEETVDEQEGLTARELGALGFERYEVSSWCKPGEQSRHNSGYWVGAEWLGLGVGAHSAWFDERGAPIRRANTRHLMAYLGDPLRSGEQEVLDVSQAVAERVFTNLRTRLGLELDVLSRQVDAATLARIERALIWCEERGLLERLDGQVIPTLRGLDMADLSAQRVWDALVS